MGALPSALPCRDKIKCRESRNPSSLSRAAGAHLTLASIRLPRRFAAPICPRLTPRHAMLEADNVLNVGWAECSDSGQARML